MRKSHLLLFLVLAVLIFAKTFSSSEPETPPAVSVPADESEVVEPTPEPKAPTVSATPTLPSIAVPAQTKALSSREMFNQRLEENRARYEAAQRRASLQPEVPTISSYRPHSDPAFDRVRREYDDPRLSPEQKRDRFMRFKQPNQYGCRAIGPINPNHPFYDSRPYPFFGTCGPKN